MSGVAEGYTARVRIFVHVLLVAVLLNLADWPYVDEIFGEAGPVSELLSNKEPPAHSRTAAHSQQGYQLLLGLQALPDAPRRLQPASSVEVPAIEYRSPRYLIPSRIDRPPIVRLSA